MGTRHAAFGLPPCLPACPVESLEHVPWFPNLRQVRCRYFQHILELILPGSKVLVMYGLTYITNSRTFLFESLAHDNGRTLVCAEYGYPKGSPNTNS
jgi:hypothetical protein